MEYAIRKNDRFDSLEITFSEKPAPTILDALKAAKFRWNRRGGFWYGFSTEEAARAICGGQEVKEAEAKPRKEAKKPQPINLDGLEKNKKTSCGADFAAVLRSELKRRGVSGFSIRSNRGGWTDSYTVTFKMEAEDFRSAEEAAQRAGWRDFFNRQEMGGGVTVDGVNYSKWNAGREDDTHKYLSSGSDFNTLRRFYFRELERLDGINPHYMERDRYPELTAAAFDRLSAALRIIQSFNWDNSEPMTDYFDVGFYLDIDLKKPEGFTPREYMTDAERAQLKKDQEAEAEEQRRQFEEWQKEQEQKRIEAEKAAEQAKKERAEVMEAVKVEDLNDAQKYYIVGLCGGIGKECTIEEIREHGEAAAPEALISRRVTFTNKQALDIFSRRLLDDWDFLRGMGGTGTNDPRVNDGNIWKLNREQRQKVEFFSVNCVAVYFENVLQFVINPEGYGYARYTYIPTEFTEELTAEESTERTKKEEAADVAPFYFPAPVEDQAAEIAAKMGEGQTITVYQPDEWISNIVHMTTGELESVEPGTWAQYKGVYMTIRTNKKSKRLFFTDSKLAVVVAGLPTITPEEIAWKRTWNSGGAILKEGRDNSEQMRMIADHCKTLAILDTVQR